MSEQAIVLVCWVFTNERAMAGIGMPLGDEWCGPCAFDQTRRVVPMQTTCAGTGQGTGLRAQSARATPAMSVIVAGRHQSAEPAPTECPETLALVSCEGESSSGCPAPMDHPTMIVHLFFIRPYVQTRPQD